MLRPLFLAILFVLIETGCKKESSCPSLDGKWLLIQYFDGTEHPIADTSVLSETLVVDNGDHFVSYNTKTNKLLNEGTIYCSKVFDLDSSSFKRGSKFYYNLYKKR